MNKPPLGTVWTAQAKLQRIEGLRWETLATCMDTPNAIIEKAQELVELGHPMTTIWVIGQATGRKMLVDLIAIQKRKARVR